MEPEVTVVVPAHGVADWIVGCVASVLAQAVPLELIVVDDTSPDDGAARAAAAIGDDPRGRVVTNQRARGGDGARNTGLALARGRYVCFCDGDDQLLEGGLARLLDAARGSRGALGAFVAADESDRPVEGLWWRLQREALGAQRGDADATDLARATLAPPPGAIILETERCRAIGGWEEGRILEGLATDYELLARYCEGATLAIVPEPVLLYRVRERSLSKGRRHHAFFLLARALAVRRAPRARRLALAAATSSRNARLARERWTALARQRRARLALSAAASALAAIAFLLVGLVTWPLPASARPPIAPAR